MSRPGGAARVWEHQENYRRDRTGRCGGFTKCRSTACTPQQNPPRIKPVTRRSFDRNDRRIADVLEHFPANVPVVGQFRITALATRLDALVDRKRTGRLFAETGLV